MLLAMLLAIAVNQAGDPTVVSELKEIEQRLAATWQKGECSAWAAMLAPGWSVIHVTGEVVTKAQALEMCKAPRPATTTFTIDDLSVRVFGDAAVVTGRTIAAGAGRASNAVVLRFTDVFIRNEGQWRVVASQATQLTARQPSTH